MTFIYQQPHSELEYFCYLIPTKW